MEVQTFEVISAQPGEGDSSLVDELTSPEAQKIIDDLGLDGQKELTTVDITDAGVSVQRNPYRLMSEQERRVYDLLLPTHTGLDVYRDGPVPLRVLQVASHASKCDEIETLVVWHPQPGDPDPILVGATPGHNQECYILARWGDVLEPFSDLVEKARKRWLVTRRQEIAEGVATLSTKKATIEEDAEAFVQGVGSTWSYHI